MGNLTKSDNTKRALLRAFTISGSNITDACQRAGFSRDTHYRLMEDDPTYAAQVPAAMKMGDDRRVDRAESMLDRKVVEGDMTAIKLTLLTKGKDRGYVEKAVGDQLNRHEIFVSVLMRAEREQEQREQEMKVVGNSKGKA